jgi:perosamine synthetase
MAEEIPLCVPVLSGNEARYLQACVETNFVSSAGPFVSRFEEMVSSACGACAAVATSSGTSGLHLALRGAGVLPDDLVIVPSYSFIATANAVVHCGAKPWFFDVDPRTWTLDARLVKDTLERHTNRTRDGVFRRETGQRVGALLPVYALGVLPEMEALCQTARDFGIPLVADAAAAIGASYRRQPLAQWADLTVFSFNGNKTVTAGGGGAVAGNNEDWLKRIRHLSVQARVGSEYHHDEVGYNYRLTNLQAAVGCAQMEQLDRFLEAKRRIRTRYDQAFAPLPGLTPFPRSPWGEDAFWHSGVIISKPEFPPVSEWVRQLAVRGIGARSFWKPLHLQPPYRSALCTDQPVAEGFWSRVLALPCSSNLTEAQQDRVIRQVEELYREAESVPHPHWTK